MKKILLCTVFSFVFAMPALAEEVEQVAENVGAEEGAIHVEQTADIAMEAVEGGVEETSEGVLKAEHEAVEAAHEAASKVDVQPEVSPAEVVVVSTETIEAVEQSDHASAQAHWGYNGGKAAPYWGTLDGAYGLCASGKEQSPVNVAKFLQEDVPDIMLSYNPSSLAVVNNGHTIQVNYDAGSSFQAGGVTYNLLQLHFHTPSEHYLDGAPYPMEMHFVHKADDGTLAVVGVMMKIGEHNPVIEGVWQNAPIQAGGSKSIEGVKINAADLMPASMAYYKYDGSLTTPPCTEGVRWHVMKEPIEISEMQLKAFQALFPVNARPVQPLNDRVITGD